MLRTTLLLIAAILSIGLSGRPASAQGVSDADRVLIQARIDELSATVTSGDMAAAITVVPPRLQTAVATRFGMTREQLVPAMRQAMATMLAGVKIEGYGMDLAAATVKTTPTGGRTYLLIPTWTEMAIEGQGRFRSDTQTLAMEEDGQWYLVRVEEEAQVALLKQTYPEFEDVTFPAGTTRPLS